MARIRYLKPDFFKDEAIAKLPHSLRLFYSGLWCQADKAGRLEDRPERLKIEIFPYEKFDTEKALQQLSLVKKNTNRPFILRYITKDEKYIQILAWEKHQKPHNTERDSEIPAPSKEQLNGYLTVIQPLDTIRDGEGEGEGDGEVLTHHLTDLEFIKELKNNMAYKHINVDVEMAKMDAWILTHRGRQKTRRFIVNWLNKIDRPVNLRPEVKPQTRKDHEKEKPHDPKVIAMIQETMKNMNTATKEKMKRCIRG